MTFKTSSPSEIGPTGLWWGNDHLSGVWRATYPRMRFMWRGHDSLYIALGRFRLRLAKPWRA
jgi:hypothetical protein